MFKRNEIDVYWSNTLNDNNLEIHFLHKEPRSSMYDLKNLSTLANYKENTLAAFNYCPSVIDFVKNSYSLVCPFDFNIEWKDNKLLSDLPENFGKNKITVRSPEINLLSIDILNFIFFADTDSLVADFTQPYLPYSDFGLKAQIIPGSIDIARWFRPYDFTFYTLPNTKINFKKGDSLVNVKFKTDKKINLKHFHMTPSIASYISIFLRQKTRLNFKLTEYWDNLYQSVNRKKMVNRIMDEIKKQSL